MADYDGILTISGGRTKRANSGDSVNIRATLRFEGSTENDHETDLAFTDPTADRTITFPDATGNVLLDSKCELADNQKIKVGTGGDLEIFHDGTNSIIKDTAASGGASIKYLAGTQTFQNSSANKTIATFRAGGAVDLHHNGTKKFETTASGVETSGTVSINGAYTFPTSDGSENQVLQTDGSGTLSFANVLTGVTASDITQGSSAATISTSSGTISIDSASELRLKSATGDIIFRDGSDSQLSLDLDSVGGQVIMALATNGDDFIFKNANTSLTDKEVFRAKDDGDFSVSANLEVRTELKLKENMGSNYVGIQAPDSFSSNYTFTLPASHGSADQILKTDGSGVLSFIDNTQVILAELSIPGVDLQTDTNAFRFNCPYALTVKKLDIFLDSHSTSGNVTVTVTNTTDSNAMISLTASGTSTSASTTTVSNSSCDSGDIITFAITATPADAQGLRANLTFVRS